MRTLADATRIQQFMKALGREADRNDPAMYPSREVLERCEFGVYKGEEAEGLYQDALTRVLAA